MNKLSKDIEREAFAKAAREGYKGKPKAMMARMDICMEKHSQRAVAPPGKPVTDANR